MALSLASQEKFYSHAISVKNTTGRIFESLNRKMLLKTFQHNKEMFIFTEASQIIYNNIKMYDGDPVMG